MANINYLIYALFGLAPSIIWLIYYLRKDVHPEPKRMVIKIFLLGALIAPIVALIECFPAGYSQDAGLTCPLRSVFSVFFSESLGTFLYMILIVGGAEEIFKYLIVRFKALRDPAFDEPTDAMIYMIIAALGFAAVENILVLFSLGKPFLITQVSLLTVYRFILPTFLHTLCSGTIGYFLAKALFDRKQKIRLMILGFSAAIFLHGLFNFSIIKIEESLETINNQLVIANQNQFLTFFLILASILVGLTIFVTMGFRKLKRLKSVSKVHLI